MKIIFLGDSITDAHRSYQADYALSSYGVGFVRSVAGRLLCEDHAKYQILNRGINGNKTVDLYARLKKDVWNENPDVLSILVGVNDLAFDVKLGCGVELKRYEKVYRAIITETLERFPNVKLILMEPFAMRGTETDAFYEGFCEITAYAKIVRSLSEEFQAKFVPLQADLDRLAKVYGNEAVLSDGVHPTLFGAELIAEKWLDTFRKI